MTARVARFTVVAALVLYAVPAAGAPIISIQPPAPTVTNGSSVSVDVAITDALDLYAFQLSVAFNPLLLAVVDVTEGPFLDSAGTGNFFPGFVDSSVDPGLLSFVANSLSGVVPGISGSGVLFSIRFKGIGVGASSITPFFDQNNGDTLLDSADQPFLMETVGGRLVVNPKPTTAPEPAVMLLVIPAALAARRRVRKALGRVG